MFEKLKKRRAFPVPGLEGVYIRLLTNGEASRAEKIEDPETRSHFVLGTVCLNDKYETECPQLPDETDLAFAARVASELTDADQTNQKLMFEAFMKLSTGQAVPIGDIAKN